MINHIRGIVDSRALDSAVLEAAGIGYRISVPQSTAEKLPAEGKEVKLFIVESTAMYGGATTFYGFLTEDERDIFLLLKEEVPGAGAKKALDYLDKVTKSLPDFRAAVVNRDITALTGIFGFTKKTAEKLAAALKDKIGRVSISGQAKWAPKQAPTTLEEAISGLVALGYRENQAREAVEKCGVEDEKALAVEEVIRRALRYL